MLLLRFGQTAVRRVGVVRVLASTPSGSTSIAPIGGVSVRCKSSSSSSLSSPSLEQKALNTLLKNAKPNGEITPKTKSSPPAFVIKNQKDTAKDSTDADKEKSKTSSDDDKKESIFSFTFGDDDDKPEDSTDKETDPVTTTTPKMVAPSKPDPVIMPQFNAPPLHEFAPKIVVVGVGGAGGNALNNMVAKGLQGVDFLALNTDAQHLSTTLTDQRLQVGIELTRGLGCGANPDAGRLAAEESRDSIREHLEGAHMVFITAGMGGGTGTGAAPVVADICQQLGILTVGVVTLPFVFEGTHRKRLALEGMDRMQSVVDTLICIPNQNLFKLAGPQTTFVDAFQMADDVLLGGVKSITDLMTAPGLINLDFADVQSVMVGMGNALLGTGVSSGSTSEEEGAGDRAVLAAQMALDNPLLGSEWDISTAKGMLVNITGGRDMTLYEVDKAAQCVTEQVKDEDANIIFGSAFDERLEGSIRVSVVATGIEGHPNDGPTTVEAAQPPPRKSRFF